MLPYLKYCNYALFILKNKNLKKKKSPHYYLL